MSVLKRKIIITEDGSHTLHIPELNEHYHSIHGAIQESTHIFIKTGLHAFASSQNISILEVGFGTGLNALLTYKEAQTAGQKIQYTGIEKYPLLPNEFRHLNYATEISPNFIEIFKQIHEVPWASHQAISPNFLLQKIKADLLNFETKNHYDLIYFDAFGPDIQPKLWTEAIFNKMFSLLNSNGKLVTYSAKGQVRRNMLASGFKVERLPGPPGKREMLRAIKL